MIAGPSEILVVADDTCNAAFVAADMLSQAEHDKLASAVLVTDSADFAEAVSKQIEEQLKKEEIEYIKTIEWIIDYNNTKDMTIEQITEYCQQILKERYRIADEYIAMSEEEKIENRTMAIQCAIYEYVINSLASMVYFKMGDIKMKLPKKVRYPKEVRKINPKKMIKSIFNK